MGEIQWQVFVMETNFPETAVSQYSGHGCLSGQMEDMPQEEATDIHYREAIWDTELLRHFRSLATELFVQWLSLDNGLAPIRQQAIIWTNDGPVGWCIYASLSLNELSKQSRFEWFQMPWCSYNSAVMMKQINWDINIIDLQIYKTFNKWLMDNWLFIVMVLIPNICMLYSANWNNRNSCLNIQGRIFWQQIFIKSLHWPH